METAILVFKASAFIWMGWVYIGYVAKAANSEPLADQRRGKSQWFYDVVIIALTFFIAFLEFLETAIEAMKQLAIL